MAAMYHHIFVVFIELTFINFDEIHLIFDHTYYQYVQRWLHCSSKHILNTEQKVKYQFIWSSCQKWH